MKYVHEKPGNWDTRLVTVGDFNHKHPNLKLTRSKTILYEKRIKPVVLFGLFISFISFLVLSRTIADMQARAQQETTQNDSELQYT